MKVFKTSLFAIAILAASLGAFASDPAESKTVEKAREAVESADSYDWQVLAKSAEKCFKKNQNIDQAMEWINKSIEINPDPSNLEIKGDYYRSVGKPSKAIEAYYEAIIVGKDQNFWFDNSHLQKKIWDIKSTNSKKLEQKGNYHSHLGQHDKATAYYFQAIVYAKEQDPSFDSSRLQKKIWSIRN